MSQSEATFELERAGAPLVFSDELADKGFLLTSTELMIAWARTGSLHLMSFGLACCAVEMMQFCTPVTTSTASAWLCAVRRASPTS